MKPPLEKGDVISCPNCGIEFGTANRDIYVGEIIKEDCFDWTLPYVDGEIMDCKECGAKWGGTNGISGTHLHTTKGWTK